VLANLATLASLLALTPAFLLSHLPPEMHAMGGFLAAALLAVERLVGVAGDRASLLVSQDLGAALSALVKGGGGGDMEGAGVCDQQGGGEGSVGEQQQDQQEGPVVGQAGAGDRYAGLLQHWRQRVQQEGDVPHVQQLLPQHSKLAASTGSSSSSRGAVSGGGDGGLLSEEQVLLMRVRELLQFGESQQYSGLMAAARPLRRVVRPGSANSSRSIKSA
jgi:hypothetical protein